MIKLANSTFTEGNVDIKIKKGDLLLDRIVVHNSATINLCELIRDALIGYSVVDRYPGMIVPCRQEQGELVPLMESGISLGDIKPTSEQSVVGDETYSVSVFKFIIKSSTLSAGELIGGFKLCSVKDASVEYAQVILPEDNQIEVERNVSLEITWRIKVRTL